MPAKNYKTLNKKGPRLQKTNSRQLHQEMKRKREKKKTEEGRMKANHHRETRAQD